MTRVACAEAATLLGLTRYLQLGESRSSESHDSMNGELFEAIFGAIYEDSGFVLGDVEPVFKTAFP